MRIWIERSASEYGPSSPQSLSICFFLLPVALFILLPGSAGTGVISSDLGFFASGGFAMRWFIYDSSVFMRLAAYIGPPFFCPCLLRLSHQGNLKDNIGGLGFNG